MSIDIRFFVGLILLAAVVAIYVGAAWLAPVKADRTK